MDTDTVSSGTPEAPSAVPPAPSPAVPQYQPAPHQRKPMSKGAKWAIGLGVFFVLLVCISCSVVAVLLVRDDGLALGDGIALVRIDGVIQGGNGSDATPEYILDQLDQALADDSVKAILLRMDSPGGTVAASQEIALAVSRAADEKPVVVSVGDICASGGYMVAAQADEIIASPGSSVGSIGVIMEVANVEELLEKVGISFTTLTSGEYKDAGSPFRNLTEAETVMLNEQLSIIYDQFINDVATGRGMPESEVRALATGWVWLGSEALDLGLVDSLGNYDDAVWRAAELGGIEGDPVIVSYEYVDPFAGLYEGLLGIMGNEQLDPDTLRRIALPR